MDIRNRIQAKFSAKTNRSFDLFSHIGRDSVGAIQFISERKEVDIKKIRVHLLLGAIDGHVKNFSILLKQGDKFELVPVYGVISTYPF